MPASLSSRRPPSRWPLRRRPSLRQHLLPPLPPRVPIMTWTPASQSAAQRRGLHLPAWFCGGAGHGRARLPQEAGAGHLERKRRQRACGDACAGFSGSGDRLSQSKGPVPSGPRTDKGCVCLGAAARGSAACGRTSDRFVRNVCQHLERRCEPLGRV